MVTELFVYPKYDVLRLRKAEKKKILPEKGLFSPENEIFCPRKWDFWHWNGILHNLGHILLGHPIWCKFYTKKKKIAQKGAF